MHAVLEGKSNKFTPAQALRVLVHLVEDVHQPLHVGTGYFDEVTQVIQSGKSSTTALTGSTEEEQFESEPAATKPRAISVAAD